MHAYTVSRDRHIDNISTYVYIYICIYEERETERRQRQRSKGLPLKMAALGEKDRAQNNPTL